MEVLWRLASAIGFLAFLATWGGLLLLPMVVVGAVIGRRGPVAARLLLLLPLLWLAALALAIRITVPYPEAPQVDLAVAIAGVAIVVCGLIAPVFARQYELLTRWTVAWLALNLLVSLSSVAVIGLISFST